MIHDESDVEEFELIAMGKRRLAMRRERLRQLSIRRGDVTPERGTRANFARERGYVPATPFVHVPTLELGPGHALPRHLPAPTTAAEISRLHSEFVAAARLCSQSYPDIDLETFSRRVTRQREIAKKRHDTQALRMRVEVVDDRPLVFIRPR